MSDLPFCKCGCGGRVTNKNNKYINGHNWRGKRHKTETLKKLRENKTGEQNPFYGKKHTEESRQKMSESKRGKKSHRKGKKLPKKVVEKIRRTHIKNGKKSWKKKYYKNDIALYDSYAHKLTVEEKPKRDDKDSNILTVLCSKCKKRFIPTLQNVVNRVRCLNGSQVGESRIYCSEECKVSCSIYRKVSLQTNHPKLENELYTIEEYQQFREFVLDRDNNKCQYCGNQAEHVHHERPQKLEAFFSLDPDLAWSVCKKCHYEKGHKDECSTGKLSKIICK